MDNSLKTSKAGFVESGCGGFFMFSGNYRIEKQNAVYFLTSMVTGWADVFTSLN